MTSFGDSNYPLKKVCRKSQKSRFWGCLKKFFISNPRIPVIFDVRKTHIIIVVTLVIVRVCYFAVMVIIMVKILLFVNCRGDGGILMAIIIFIMIVFMVNIPPFC